MTPSAFPLASGLPLEVCFLVLYSSRKGQARGGGGVGWGSWWALKISGISETVSIIA